MISIILAIAIALLTLAAIIFVALPRLQKRKPLFEQLTEKHIHPEIPSQFMDLEGVRIHYNQLGKGPDLLLLHGIGASTFTMRKLILTLQKHFRVTALDFPGFGLSQKLVSFPYDLDSFTNFTEKFLARLGLKSVYVVGSSMGGEVGLWLNKRYPNLVRGIVTIAPSVDPALVPAPTRVLELLAPLSAFVNKRTIRRAVGRVVGSHDFVDDEMVHGYSAPYADDGSAWKCFLKASNIIADPRIPGDLRTLNTQANFHHKILYGDRDIIVPLRVMQKLKDVLPKSVLVIIKNAGHHPFEDQHERVASEIIEFFGQ